MVKDDFNYFIGESIEGCIRDMKNTNKKYIKEKDVYKTMYDSLSKNLDQELSVSLDNLLEQLLYTVGMEREAIYITAIQDVRDIMDFKIKDIQ